VIDNILQQYNRFEPYLRQALERFLVGLGHQIEGNRFFQIAIYNLPNIHKVRDLKTANLGRIMSIEGTVTRTTEVKPELSIGTFKCKMCDTYTEGIE
jgi:DNA replication licensing factor MCM6